MKEEELQMFDLYVLKQLTYLKDVCRVYLKDDTNSNT